MHSKMHAKTTIIITNNQKKITCQKYLIFESQIIL